MTLKEKLPNVASICTGIFGLFGSWNVCHQVCMGLLALAGILGVSASAVGMPLAFLQPYALPLWSLAVVFFGISIFMFFKMKGCCMSREALLANFGILVFAVPFEQVESVRPLFWLAGVAIIVFAAVLWLKKGRTKRKL